MRQPGKLAVCGHADRRLQGSALRQPGTPSLATRDLWRSRHCDWTIGRQSRCWPDKRNGWPSDVCNSWHGAPRTIRSKIPLGLVGKSRRENQLCRRRIREFRGSDVYRNLGVVFGSSLKSRNVDTEYLRPFLVHVPYLSEIPWKSSAPL
jgi:hypothetical protein